MTELIDTQELMLLRQVFDSALNYQKSKVWSDFAECYPPEITEKILFTAITALRQYYYYGA